MSRVEELWCAVNWFGTAIPFGSREAAEEMVAELAAPGQEFWEVRRVEFRVPSGFGAG